MNSGPLANIIHCDQTAHMRFLGFLIRIWLTLFTDRLILANYVVPMWTHSRQQGPVFEKFEYFYLFICVEVLRPSQPNGVMLSAVSLPSHTFTGQGIFLFCLIKTEGKWILLVDFCHFTGRQLFWLSACIPPHQFPSEKRSTLWEQILSF